MVKQAKVAPPKEQPTVQIVKVQYEEKVALLVSLIERRQKDTISIVFLTEHQVQFINELFLLLNISHSLKLETLKQCHFFSEAKFNAASTQQSLTIYFDPPAAIKGTLQGQVLVFTLDCESKVDFAGYKTQESTFAKQKLTTYAVEKLERLTEKNFSLYTAAVTAFKEYVKHYQKLDQTIFQFSALDPYRLGKQFGLKIPPKVTNYILKKPSEYAPKVKPIQKKKISKRSIKRRRHKENKQG